MNNNDRRNVFERQLYEFVLLEISWGFGRYLNFKLETPVPFRESSYILGSFNAVKKS